MRPCGDRLGCTMVGKAHIHMHIACHAVSPCPTCRPLITSFVDALPLIMMMGGGTPGVRLRILRHTCSGAPQHLSSNLQCTNPTIDHHNTTCAVSARHGSDCSNAPAPPRVR